MSLAKFPDFLLNFLVSEMNGKDKHFYRFKSFRLDVEERQLLQNGNVVPLAPKVFDVLAVLVRNSGHLVEKDELLRIVWAGSFVEESNISRIVHTLRKVLGETEKGSKFIETVATKGYRFVAKVTEVREPIVPKSANGTPEITNFVEKPAATEVQIPPEIAEAIPAPEAKPKQKMRSVLFAVGFLSAVSLIFLLSFNYSSKSSVNPSEIKSIAVLPLKPVTAENRDAIYDFGIADSLILKLSSAKNLVVRPLSATRQYDDLKQDAVAAGKEQKVDYVLASNYQIADGKIRITSQLINVQSGQVEEIFKDEREISNIFAVQDAVAGNIGQRLLKKLNRESNNVAAKRSTTSEEAYRLYLTGSALVSKRTRKDAEKAVEYLEEAVRLDPNYALAYARLAGAHGAIANFGGENHEQYLKQKAATEKALAIDENLPEAYLQLGEMKLNYEWDFDGAERAIKKAIELDPDSGHGMYGLYLSSMGRFDEAIAEIKIAIDLQPSSVLTHRLYGQFLYLARRYPEAIVQLERTVEMDPNFRTTYGWLINSCKMNGGADNENKAFEWFLRSPGVKNNPEKIPMWKEIYAKSGWRGINEQQIKEAKDWEKPYLYAELGDKEQAIVSLEKFFSSNQRGWQWTTLKVDPRYDLIRSDPRFENIVRRIGLK